jgi:hypothetical protein
MFFFTDFKAASQDILGEVGQEAALEDVEKGGKSELFALRNRFIGSPRNGFFYLVNAP